MKTEMFMCSWHEQDGTMCANLIVNIDGVYYCHFVDNVECGELKGESAAQRSSEMYNTLVSACKKDSLDVSKMTRAENSYNYYELNWYINNKKGRIL